MRYLIKSLFLGGALAAANIASAGPLDDYNLILTGDYNYQGGEVEGATLIGGNLNAAGHSPTFGTRPFTNPVGLQVVGDINATNMQINRGDLVYGGALNVTNVNMNGGGSVTFDDTFDMSAIISDLTAESDYYLGLTANGSLSGGILSYGGSDSLAVFDLAATDVFAQNSTLKLQYGSADTVVINVSGQNINIGGGVNITDGFRDLGAANIVWNFFEAETINFNGIGMYGAVLALDADTSGGSVFDGSFAAQSFTGAREFHQFGFNSPPIQVPAPAALWLVLSGLVALRLGRHRAK